MQLWDRSVCICAGYSTEEKVTLISVGNTVTTLMRKFQVYLINIDMKVTLAFVMTVLVLHRLSSCTSSASTFIKSLVQLNIYNEVIGVHVTILMRSAYYMQFYHMLPEHI